MPEDNKNEILQRLIDSAQNVTKLTIMDLKEFLLAEHVDSDEEFEFYKNELNKLGLLIEDMDAVESDYIDEPTSDEIENLEEEEEDDLLNEDEDLIEDDTDNLDLIDEPTDEELDEVEEEESDDDEDDEDENIDERDSYTKSFIRENYSEGGSPMDGMSIIDEDVEQSVHRPSVLGTDKGETSSDDPIRLYLREIGRETLLTADEEVELSKQMEEGALIIKNVIQKSGIMITCFTQILEKLNTKYEEAEDYNAKDQKELITEQKRYASFYKENLKECQSAIRSYAEMKQNKFASGEEVLHN